MNINPGESALPCSDGVDDDTHWVEHATGTVRVKGDYPLNALPLPCTVTIEGVAYPCTEQPTFEFAAPGNYLIQVDAGPRYLKKEFSLDNPAQFPATT
ncbi:hypothetical protein MBH78_19185 [Oceanimonas sp. NS1]|nr:hypothetical protein [Oceanimonas sp. NS1]